jgi:single-strand DNA-binding protein
MANFNRVILAGRLTRDPEHKTFGGGGAVAKFGFAVTNRRKNSQTGEWEDEPMFIDVEVFNRGDGGKLADFVGDRCGKGSNILIEGRLQLDQWDDKNTGQKRQKHKLVAVSIQLLDPRSESGGQHSPASKGRGGQRRPANDYPPDDGDGGEIPF